MGGGAEPIQAEHEARRAQWLKGVLDLCLLGVLRHGEAYGYEIGQQLQRAGLGEVKGGTLYPRLSALETAGLLDVDWRAGEGGPGRKYYRLTDKGRAVHLAASQEFRRFSAAATSLIGGDPEVAEAPPAPALVASTTGSGRAPDEEHGTERSR